MNPFTFVATRIDRFVLPVVSLHALDVLKREYGRTTAHQILWHSWDAFGQIARRIPARRPPAARLELSFAAASAALHRALISIGIEESHATTLVAEIATRSYRKLSRIPWWLARLVTMEAVPRLSVATRLFGWLSDGSSYARRENVPENGSVTMDVHRCAALDLYHDLGIPHLSRPLVCDLELAVAERDTELPHAHARAERDPHRQLDLLSIAPQPGGRYAQQPVHQ